jgi:hypothetical protein
MAPHRLSGLALTVAAVLAAGPAHAWGPVAHQAVLLKAIDTLPSPLKSFYRTHRLELPSLAPDAEAPPAEEASERRFTVDKLLPFPFLDLPRTEAAFNARFGEEGGRAGRLPWLIQEGYARLHEAFKTGDKARILAESDALAGLVADLKNPLALSENADGQKTGQHGLFVRFSTRLPEAMDRRLKLNAEAARYLDEPREYIFGMIAATYVWLDNLLYQEAIAKRGKSGYTEIYYESFELRCGEILKDRLGEAATDAGSYWYSAWIAAGKPDLK